MLIPYVFVAGTKAKAEEVNTNFREVQKYINANETAIANVESNITNKANLTGDVNTTFKVANANNSNEAVNLGQVQNMISVYKSLIEGYLFKVVGTTINITDGKCFDSLGNTIIEGGARTLTVGSYPLNTEYYIFVEMDTIGPTTPSYSISANADSPTNISPTTVFRKLGSFIKSSDTAFENVSMIGTRINKDEVTNVELL